MYLICYFDKFWNTKVEPKPNNYERKTRFGSGTSGIQELHTGEIGKSSADYEILKILLLTGDDNDTQDTSPTFKILEEGAATLSKEEAGKLAQRQLKFIQHLQAALIRIENKTYGVCRETGKLISKERLRAVPHATLSIDAKNMQH